MKNYAVLHVSKGKGSSTGLQKHIDRDTMPRNADKDKGYLNEINTIRKDFKGLSLGERADMIIQESGVSRKIQKDAVKYCPIILSGSHERMKQMEHNLGGELKSWADDNYKFIADKYGEKNIISFALHRDELTPHIHCVVVPLLEDTDKKGNKRTRLTARDMFGPEQLKNLQNDYAKAMNKYGLERGEENSKAEHQTVSQFYKLLPDKLHELQKTQEEKQQQVVKLNAEIATLSVAKGLKNTVEGIGNFISGNKEKKKLIEDVDTLKTDLNKVLKANEEWQTEYKKLFMEHVKVQGYSNVLEYFLMNKDYLKAEELRENGHKASEQTIDKIVNTDKLTEDDKLTALRICGVQNVIERLKNSKKNIAERELQKFRDDMTKDLRRDNDRGRGSGMSM